MRVAFKDNDNNINIVDALNITQCDNKVIIDFEKVNKEVSVKFDNETLYKYTKVVCQVELLFRYKTADTVSVMLSEGFKVGYLDLKCARLL